MVGKILDQRLEERLQREAHDDHRDHRKDDLQHVGLFRVESFGEESHDQAFDFAPEHDDRTQDRRGVQREIEGESSHFGIDAQQFFGQRRWPPLDTGRNSVRPWTMPRMIA